MVYLDNASTTAVHPEVIQLMTEQMNQVWGNPSSTHSLGRQAKSAIESARKTIAKLIGASSNEIIFTSGATEALHTIIHGCIEHHHIQRIITTKIEHHAVLDTIQSLKHVEVNYLSVSDSGEINYNELEKKLQENIPTLVCLMHVNNEIGNITDLKKVSHWCAQYQALFLSDTVQSLGKEIIDVSEVGVDFLIGSAHKFHGPKGIGFYYKKKTLGLPSVFKGGDQEKGLRAGTENTFAIVGMAKALEIAIKNLAQNQTYLFELKEYAKSELLEKFPETIINGSSDAASHILNITLPLDDSKASMIVFLLDMNGICVSRGSACQSGSSKPSHVLQEILPDNLLKKPSIRISFSYLNTKNDIDELIIALQKI